MTLKRAALIFLPAALVCLTIVPQAPSAGVGLRIEDLMSAAEFRDAGLGKLSPQELANLDSWLNSYLLRVIARATHPPSSKTPDVIESQIDGDFEGWSGETIFKLKNGQIWQQAEYDYDYEYDFEPDVTIYKTSSGGYKMQVKGMDETIAVKRIK